MVRVRFAPSPTGNLHIGTIRTALFNWLFARANKGTFIVRIEDTDLKRSKPEFEQNIMDGMTWFGIEYDEGPFHQSQHIQEKFYDMASEKLLASQHAYHCFCTDEDLDTERKAADAAKKPYVYSQKCLTLSESDVQSKLNEKVPYTIRFKMPDDSMTMTDLIRGEITFDLSLISDFVLMKSDGSPTYNFACVVDDASMDITHVIRGEDHISNTPRQIALYEALGHSIPQFAHMPMILGPDKSKLSKRHGATSITEYAEQGFLAEAMFNFLCLLGWSPKDEQEILSKDAIIQQFSLDRVTKSGAVFDIKKLTWMNGQYIRKLDIDAFYEWVWPFVSEENKALLKESPQKECLYSVRDNLDVLSDINQYLVVYTMSEADFKQQLGEFELSEQDQTVIGLFKEKFQGVSESFNSDDITPILDAILAETGLGKGKVFSPIRKAVTALKSGPNMGEIMVVFGKDKVLSRLSS